MPTVSLPTEYEDWLTAEGATLVAGIGHLQNAESNDDQVVADMVKMLTEMCASLLVELTIRALVYTQPDIDIESFSSDDIANFVNGILDRALPGAAMLMTQTPEDYATTLSAITKVRTNLFKEN